MSVTQPRTFAEIDYAGLGKGIQLLFNPALGPVDLATGRVWTAGGGAAVTPGGKGRSFAYSATGDYHGYTGYPEITSNVGTFFMWCPIVGAPDSNGHVYFGASSPAVCGHQVNGSGLIIIGTGSGGSSGPLSGWFNSSNRSLVLVSNGTAAGTKAFIDGKDTGFTWGSPPTAWGTGNKNFNLGRYVGAAGFQFTGSILSVGMTSAVWGAAEAKAFHQNPWQIFKNNKRKLPSYFDTGPTFFDSDFTHSGSSLFSVERSSVFSIYYNFNGITDSLINNSAIISTDANISGVSSTNIQSQKIHSVVYTSNGTCVVTYQVGPDLIKTIFAQDSFSGTPGQDVLSYNTDWFKSTYNGSDFQFIITDEQRAITTSANSATPVYFYRNIPATADYDVSADVHIKSAVETFGLIGRASDTTRNHYLAQLTSGFIKLFRIINWGTATLIQQKPITLTVGQTYNIKLSMFGSSIKVFVDGVETLSGTDSGITDKGYAGIRMFFDNPANISYTSGMHLDNFLAENTNVLNKNIISINMFPVGTSISDPKIQSIFSQNLSSNNTSNFSAEQSAVNNIEVSSVSLTTEEFLDSIITSSKISSDGLSVSNISNNIIKSSNTNISAFGTQDVKTQSIININTDISGVSTQNLNDTIIQNKSFNSIGLSETDIKSAYSQLCELVSNSSSVEELISAITHNTEINSVGSCIVTFYEGTDGGITYINVDFIVSGSSTALPTIQKVFNSTLLSDSTSFIDLEDNAISLSEVSSTGISSSGIDIQKLLSSDVTTSGESITSIITNIVLNSRIISTGVSNQLINSISIQNTDIESIGSSITNFIDNFIQSTDFLSNGTCVVSIQQGQDGGKIIINVDFIMDGTSSINNNNGLTLNTNLQSQSTSDFISKFTKIDGQDFTTNGSSIIDFIREYLVLQTNRKYISVAERRNYVSKVERRNYVSKVKG